MAIPKISNTNLVILHHDPYSQTAVTFDPGTKTIERWEASFYPSDSHKMVFEKEGHLNSVMKSDKGAWWQSSCEPLDGFPGVMVARFQIGVIRYGAYHWLVQYDTNNNKAYCHSFKGCLAGAKSVQLV
jgi:hypothetical protein